MERIAFDDGDYYRCMCNADEPPATGEQKGSGSQKGWMLDKDGMPPVPTVRAATRAEVRAEVARRRVPGASDAVTALPPWVSATRSGSSNRSAATSSHRSPPSHAFDRPAM